ncbi:MAG: DUF4013 domain-containing protein [Atopobiaceae bacterium]
MAESADAKEYMSRSWRMLTHDKGWYKPLLVLPLAKLVPIAGPLGVWGYQAEWARLTAWGRETYPKQRNVKAGACIKSGWRVFLAMLGYLLIYIVLAAAVRPAADGFVGLIWSFLTLLWTTIMWVAALRATIYQHVKAGYQLDRIWEMVKHDFGSICEIALILFLGTLLIEGFCVLCALIIFVPSLTELVSLLSYSGSAAAIAVLAAHLLSRFAPWLVLVLYLAAVFATTLQTVAVNALGLWFRQFDVPDWGSSKDPLPGMGTKDGKEQEDAAPAAAEPEKKGAENGTDAAPEEKKPEPETEPAHEPSGTAADEPEAKKPAGGLPAIGESSAPADEPATLIMSHPEDSSSC